MLSFTLLLAASLGLPCSGPQDAGSGLEESQRQRIDAIFAPYDTDQAAGMSVAVYREGRIIYERGFGLASMEHGVPNTPATIFRIGSTSKQFTAACVVILSLMEELSLEDDIRKHLPEMRDYGTPITINQLLHHTSGLRDYINLAVWMGRSVDGMSSDECIAAVARQRGLCFEPGSTYAYSNSNYLLLGEIVKRVSGQSLAEFAKENIFDPLRMDSTHFQDRHGHVVKGRALGYSPGLHGELELNLTKNDCVGDGGVFTSVRDMLRWDANFYAEALTGGLPFNRIMQSTGYLNDESPLAYASGLILANYGGLPVVMHGGEWVGYLAEMVRFPDQKTTVICLANRSDINPTGLCLQVANVLLGDLLPNSPALDTLSDFPAAPGARQPGAKETPQPKREHLASLVGSYHAEDLLCDWHIELVGQQLHLKPYRGPGLPLSYLGADCFGDRQHQVQFLRTDGQLSGFWLWIQDQGEFEFKRR